MKGRETNPERSVRGIQHLGAVKGLWGSAVASWKTEENPGAILAFVLGTEDLLEVGAGPEGSYPQKSTELSPFLSLLPDFWVVLFHALLRCFSEQNPRIPEGGKDLPESNVCLIPTFFW